MMSRPIKFRTWDKEFQEFAEWTNRDPFFSTSHEQVFYWERTEKEDGSFGGDIILRDNQDRFVLQQFTGVLDRNGKEIYEGDYLKYDNPKSVLTVEWKAEDQGYDWTGYDVGMNLGEVIGNIFENKDLII